MGRATGFLPGMPPWAVQTKDAKAEKTDHLPRSSTEKPTKIEKSSTQANQLKTGRFSIFLGGETNKPIARKNADFKQVATGSFQLPLGDLRFWWKVFTILMEAIMEHPETGCFNVAETWILVEYKGKDALVYNNCQKKNKQ